MDRAGFGAQVPPPSPPTPPLDDSGIGLGWSSFGPSSFASPGRQTHAERMENRERNFEDVAPNLRASALRAQAPPVDPTCVACGTPACVRCRHCVGLGGRPLATWFFGGCDAEQHTLAHFHRREVWIKGYFQPVPMHMDVQQDSPGATSSAGATLRVTLGATRPAGDGGPGRCEGHRVCAWRF